MSLLSDAIAAIMARSEHAASSGVKIPQLFEPVSKTWVPPTGSAEGAQSVQLTGRKLKVGVYRQSVDTAVVADATSTLTITPTAGYIGRLKHVTAYCAAVAGSTGNHFFRVQLGTLNIAAGIYSINSANAAGTAPLILPAGGSTETGVAYKDIVFDAITPLVISYTAPGTNPQASPRYYNVVWEEEAMV